MTFRRVRLVAFAVVFAAGVAWRLPSPAAGQASVIAATATGQAPRARLVGVVTDVESHAGEQFSGSLVTNPADFKNTRGVNVVLVPLPEAPGTRLNQPVDLTKLIIDFGGGNLQPGDRPFTLKPPAGSATAPFTVRLRGQPAAPDGSSAIRLSLGAPILPPPLVFQIPSMVMPGEVAAIRGPFSGDSRTTPIDLDHVPIDPLTETPCLTRILFPSGTSAGPHELSVGTSRGQVTLPVDVVTLTMSADRVSLLRGQSTPFHVVISGLDRLPDSSWKSATPPRDADLDLLRRTPGFKMPGANEEGRIFLRLENATRGTVTMRPGRNEVELRSLSQSEFRNGPYKMDGVITSRVAGDFVVDGLVVPFLAPSTASPAPPPQGSNPFQESINRLRTATDNVRRAMDGGAKGERVRSLVYAVSGAADRVSARPNSRSWNVVAGAPELEWLMFMSEYAERLVRIQETQGKANRDGEVRDLAGQLRGTHLLLEAENLPAEARQALARLGTAEADVLRTLDAGNNEAVAKAVQPRGRRCARFSTRCQSSPSRQATARLERSCSTSRWLRQKRWGGRSTRRRLTRSSASWTTATTGTRSTRRSRKSMTLPERSKPGRSRKRRYRRAIVAS